MDLIRLWIKISSKWRVLLIILVPAMMLYTLVIMLSPSSVIVNNGEADLSKIDFEQNKLVPLNGQWEFYWGRLLTPEKFAAKPPPQMNSVIKVPGSWTGNKMGQKVYPDRGIATYRVRLNYPSVIKDPALSLGLISTAYKLYANGRLIAEAGRVSDKPSDFEESVQQLIVDLPKDTQSLDLVFQVANLNYSNGGIRESPVFGSKQVLERQNMMLLILELFLIGSVLIFGIYYFLVFLLQTKNKAALFFCLLCFIIALRTLVWGEKPLLILFPDVSFNVVMYINYLTGYNFLPSIILFILSLYPLDYQKKTLFIVLMPNLFFEALLLTSTQFMSFFTNYLYPLILIQMVYIMIIMIKAVFNRRDNAILMYVAICVLVLAINQDLLHYTGIGDIGLSYSFLIGNLAVIVTMSFVQAKQQAMNHKKLVLYNEKLLETDMLKDKIMATEMSFLQAQIKPHFLYNALNAIANVCEKDGKQAGKLVIDLAIYLRGSLEFNNLNKLVNIGKELEFVDTYFNIEQARFGQKIQLEKEIEVPLDVHIPVLILQPLVENAVRHGISKKLDGGTVTLRMMQKNESICIEIEDDGVGINGDKLATLLSGNNIAQGVGLLNIHNRLLKLYGRGLEISSESGHTCVKLSIPEVQ